MNKRIKVGVVGLGRIGRAHVSELLALSDLYEVTAVADQAPDRLADLPPALAGGHVATFASLEEMLDSGLVDMVTIAVRHPDHVPMALKILSADQIAVVEKPVATSIAEMKQLGQALKKHPGKLFFRHNRRFEPAFMKARELVDAGLIGHVQVIKLYRAIAYCRRNDWMTMTEFYGGLLSNWGPHLIDQALMFLDAPVIDLWADVRNVISIGDGDDFFKILLRAENGRVADIEVTGANTMAGREMEIIGTRGTIVYNGGKFIEARCIDPSLKLKKLKPHPENPPLAYGNFDERLAFVESKFDVPPDEAPKLFWTGVYDQIINGVPFTVTYEQSLNTVTVTEKAFRKSGFKPMLNTRFLKSK